MSEIQVYVGDNILDIKPGQVVSISIKNIDIGDLSARFISYSNNFKVVWSESMMVNLGMINSELSRSRVPYELNSGKVVQNGIETIPNATVIVRNTNSSEATVNVYDNTFDYFKIINNLKLTDVNPIPSSAWNASDIDSARTNTSGIVSAIVYYGQGVNIYDSDFFLPSFYYKTLVTSTLEYTGLNLSGSVLTDTRFTDLIIPFPGSQFTYNQSLISSTQAKGTSPGQLVASPSIAVGVQMNISATYGDIVSNEYVHGSDYVSVYISASISVSSVSWISATLSFARIIRFRGGIETTLATSSNITSPSASGSFNFNAGTVLLENDDRIYVKFFSDSASSPTVTYQVSTSSTLEIVPSNTVSRDMVSWNDLLPEINCKDLIKDFFVRFGIIPKVSNGTLYLKTFEEICTDRFSAVDWSDKIADTSVEIDFTLGYSQNNYFSYRDSDDVMNPEIGRGNMSIDNELIQNSKTIFKSFFGNTVLKTDLNDRTYRVAYIPIYDSTSVDIADFKIDPGLRLLTSRQRSGAESTVVFDAIARSDYIIATFVDAAQTKDTGFQYFLDQFYPSLSSSLQRNKIITKLFNLTELDIYQYDPHKMVWDGEGYYVVNKISNFIPGNITKVELFKVG